MINGAKKNLLENIFSLASMQIVSYVIPLITLPYLSRVLSTNKFGIVFFAYAFISYFNILTDYGFSFSATKEIAINRHNKNNLSNIFNAVIFNKIILVFISYLILIFCTIFIPKIHNNWLLFQLTFLSVIGNAIYPVWFFQGMERMKYISILNILAKIIFLLLIFVFVKQDSDYILVPFFNSFGFILSGLIGFIFSIKKMRVKFYIPKVKSIKKQFIYSTDFFFSRAAATLYTDTNTFLLGLISSNVVVAYYVAATKIYNALQLLATPLENALYPFIAKNKDVKLFKKIYFLAIMIGIGICTLIFIFAKKIILIVYGINLIEAYKVLRIFCVTLFISWNTILISYPLLGAMGHTKEVNRSVIIASFIHIIGLFILYKLSILNIYTIPYLIWVTEGYTLCSVVYYIIKYKLLKTENSLIFRE